MFKSLNPGAIGVKTDLPGAARLAAAYGFAGVHINDAPAGIAPVRQMDRVRALPGETGVIDVPRFLKTLSSIGYHGPVMVEPFSERVNALPPEDAVQVTAEALDAVWRAAGLV